jgi:V/A-type H+-transporting ATPase subunit F
MDFKIAIIGPKDAIIGFSALGVVPFESYSADEALEILKKIKLDLVEDNEDQFAIVLINEDIIKDIPQDEYKKITKEALPAIISVPGIQGSTGFGAEKVRRMVEQAVGSDIFGEK